MSEKFLEIKNLTIEYKSGMETVHAVNSISLNLQKGQTLGLVGETGAGKTTTALSLLRLLPRNARIVDGEINFEGRNLLSINEDEMRSTRGEKISMIFQDPMTALNPVKTVGSQIAESLITHNTNNNSKEEIEKRVDDVLELVGIPATRRNEYPHQFSGGMKQRVMIAIALSCEPDLLIADEPTTALDVTIQAQILALMNDLRKRMDMSIIMITHDLGIIAETCDYVAVVYAGEIIEYGSVRDIFSDIGHHPYTIGLFGAIPNLRDRNRRLSPIEGLMPDPTNLPEGCSFSPRCPNCTERCKREKPLYYDDNGHKIMCHLFEDGVAK